MAKITIKAGPHEFAAELYESGTGKAIAEELPIEGQAQRWDGEIYFMIPVVCDLETDSRDVLVAGEIAYWPTAQAFCIFFGSTPASQGDEIRAASNVNVIGKVTADLSELWNVANGEQITIELAE